MNKLLVILFIGISLSFNDANKIQKIINHAKWQSTQDVTYDGRYMRIGYPGGDVPPNIGVCTDVIIRAYRSVNIDLQKLIHEDIVNNPGVYNVKKVDSNIDHRRVPNMKRFLKRKGAQKSVTYNESDYLPGDIVFWNVAAGHVGLVTDIKIPNTNRYLVVHNIGAGPQIEDFLFRAQIVDHYRWFN
jgi:uncharacterized protein YijF (DUF1287 family)